MKNNTKNSISTKVKLGLILIIAISMHSNVIQAQTSELIRPNPTPDIIKNALDTIPTVNLDLTSQQLELIRLFIMTYANTIPNLTLTQEQINSILSYFDETPSILNINLTAAQIQALQSYFVNNFDEIARLQLSQQDLSTILTVITNNSPNISTLINSNPGIATLIRNIAPQINQLATLNSQINTLISVLRTTVPEINSLLSI
jgi:hypothetical protein